MPRGRNVVGLGKVSYVLRSLNLHVEGGGEGGLLSYHSAYKLNAYLGT